MDKLEIRKIFKDKNLKYTPQRDVIIDILLQSDGYTSVKDIYSKVKDIFPQISLDTVYRNLEIMRDINILFSCIVGSNTLYEIRKDNHNHILKCLKCGRTIVINFCPLDYCINNIDDFKILDHKLEINGICKKCLDNKEQNR